MNSFSDLNEDDHQFLDQWVLVEEEIQESLQPDFLQKENPNDVTILSPKPLFGQPASFTSPFNQVRELSDTHEAAFPSFKPYFSTPSESSANIGDYFIDSAQDLYGNAPSSVLTTIVATSPLIEPNSEDQDIKVSAKKPKALQTSVLQSENTSIRRSSRVRVPKVIPDSIIEMPIKKSRSKRKVTILLNTTNSTLFADENCNEEPIKKRQKKEIKSENYEQESFVDKKALCVKKLNTNN